MDIAVGDNQHFTIIVPEGVQGGDLIDVDLPVAAEEPPSTVVVAVPEGCFAGDEFVVAVDGVEFSIFVPNGCCPGDEIEVEVPTTT